MVQLLAGMDQKLSILPFTKQDIILYKKSGMRGRFFVAKKKLPLIDVLPKFTVMAWLLIYPTRPKNSLG